MRIKPPSSDLGPYVRILERERRQLTEERRAFKRFSARVAKLDATPSRPGETPIGCVHDSESTGLRDVQRAYKETVLGVLHYTDVYGEPWHENMAEEFGEEVVVPVQQADGLDPRVKQLLVEGAHQAANQRTKLLEPITSEMTAIEDTDQVLSELREELRSLLEQPLDQLGHNALRLTRERLLTVQDRCDELAAERQTRIRRRRQHLTIADIGTFERYLYGECENTYPVLATIADLGTVAEQAVAIVERSLIVPA